jgi:hypothetical protein
VAQLFIKLRFSAKVPCGAFSLRQLLSGKIPLQNFKLQTILRMAAYDHMQNMGEPAARAWRIMGKAGQ